MDLEDHPPTYFHVLSSMMSELNEMLWNVNLSEMYRDAAEYICHFFEFLRGYIISSYIWLDAQFLNKVDQSEWFNDFTDFQIQLLQCFLTIIAVDSILILLTWQLYKSRIHHHLFTKEGIKSWKKNMVILRKSLQLPKEHDFKQK
uniref:Uncharacterized protein n=1 Tax=Lepeophtheirus salmonis TaxID=72036 RepID=A0A0K2VFL2_LEPSM|nr:uncharacterized protein LOC121115805 [Lepeophtheirus salmonis]